MFWSKVKQLLGLHKHKALAQKGKKSHRSDDQTAAYRFKKFVDANLVTKEGTIEYKLAKAVAKEVVGLSREEVQKFYIYHLTRMRLMTEEGQWKNDLGKKIALPDVDGNGLADKCFKSATLLTAISIYTSAYWPLILALKGMVMRIEPILALMVSR